MAEASKVVELSRGRADTPGHLRGKKNPGVITGLATGRGRSPGTAVKVYQIVE